MRFTLWSCVMMYLGILYPHSPLDSGIVMLIVFSFVFSIAMDVLELVDKWRSHK